MKTTVLPILLLVLLLVSCSDKKPKKDFPKSEVKPQPKEILIPVEETTELPIHETKYRILPVDESSSDESLRTFVIKLKEIVNRKDVPGLISCLDTGIVVSWGGGMYGIQTFLEESKLDVNPEKSPFWRIMKRYIDLGGAWDNNKEIFRFPYAQCDLFFKDMDLDFDWYFTAICVSPQTIVYKRPAANSKRTTVLSYEVLKFTESIDGFIKIETADKEISGFVKEEQLVFSGEAHPILEKINGQWKITSFAGYD